MENNGIKVTVDDQTKNWHSKIIINTKHVPFTLKETIMGCGIAQLYGVGQLKYLTKEELSELKDLLVNKITNLDTLVPNSSYSCMKVGLIIATLGQSYRVNNEELLLSLGFTELSAYSNWRHREDGTEIQKLYGLKTNYKGRENI